jgi:hypothetical protein
VNKIGTIVRVRLIGGNHRSLSSAAGHFDGGKKDGGGTLNRELKLIEPVFELYD